jgi:SSS family transporter
MDQLNAWDYTIIIGYLLGVVALGSIFCRKQKSLTEYFLASGNMPWLAVSISMFATAFSPVSFLGAIGWIYAKDIRWPLGTAVVSLVTIVIAARIWVPVWGRLQQLSIFEYLEHRYHPAVRTFGATLFPIQMTFWLGNGLVASSMAFETVTHIPAIWCIVGIVALGTLYTGLGGARAVVWTDVAQFLVFLFAYVLIALLILKDFNWQPWRIYETVAAMKSPITGYPPTQFISYEFKLAIESTIWAIMFVMLMDALQFGGNQVIIQRMLATGPGGKMYKAVIGQAWIGLIWVLLTIAVAWGLLAFYQVHPDAPKPDHPDDVLAQYVVSYVPMAVRGIIMAGLLAAMMSTFSAAINSMSSVIMNDFYKRYFVRRASEKHYVASSRVITVLGGLALIGFSVWQLNHAQSTALERLGALNVLIAAPLITFFVLGVFFKRVNTPGVLVGGFAGIIAALILNGIPGMVDPPIGKGVINWMWIGGFSAGVSFVVGYLVSLLFDPPDPSKLKGLTVAVPLDPAAAPASVVAR